MNFTVEYTFKRPPSMLYRVAAETPEAARQIADSYVRIVDFERHNV